MENSNKKETKIQKRRDDRQLAFSFVFERMFRDDSVDEAFDDAIAARDATPSDYVRTVVEGVEKNLTEIDNLIESNLKGWKKNRISKISLTILRIAVFEMVYMKEIPTSVSINEAVELAKNYASEKDSSFVNGVLGAISKSINQKNGEQ